MRVFSFSSQDLKWSSSGFRFQTAEKVKQVHPKEAGRETCRGGGAQAKKQTGVD